MRAKQPRVITLAQLKRLHACEFQCVKFEDTFGEKCVVTEANVLPHAELFSLAWAVCAFLNLEGREAFYSRIVPANDTWTRWWARNVDSRKGPYHGHYTLPPGLKKLFDLEYAFQKAKKFQAHARMFIELFNNAGYRKRMKA